MFRNTVFLNIFQFPNFMYRFQESSYISRPRSDAARPPSGELSGRKHRTGSPTRLERGDSKYKFQKKHLREWQKEHFEAAHRERTRLGPTALRIVNVGSLSEFTTSTDVLKRQ